MKCKKALRLLYGTAFAALLLTCAAFAALEARGAGEDSARAAAFAVDAWLDGSGNGYVLSVSNTENGRTSETALSYSVTISLSSKLPEGVTAYFDGNKLYFNGTQCTIPNAGTLTAGGARTNEHSISFDTQNSAADASITVSVLVMAEQID